MYQNTPSYRILTLSLYETSIYSPAGVGKDVHGRFPPPHNIHVLTESLIADLQYPPDDPHLLFDGLTSVS